MYCVVVRVVGGVAVERLVAEAAGLIAGFEAQLGGHVFKCAFDVLDALLKNALLSRPIEELVDTVREFHRREGRACHVDLDAKVEAGKFGDGTGWLGDDVGGKDVLVVDWEGQRGIWVGRRRGRDSEFSEAGAELLH